MLASTLPLIVACLFAAALGFSAHRGSICIVRAASEVLSARTVHMLWSIGKSMLWVILLTLPFSLVMPMTARGGWLVTGAALAGGLAFGFGAAINGGCSFSTMARLADGEGGKTVTVVGFALGVLATEGLLHWGLFSGPQQAPPMQGAVMKYAALILIALLAWTIYELQRIWRTRESGMKLLDLVCVPQYRLSVAALLIGIASSGIYLLLGSPGYSITVQSTVSAAIGMNAAPSAMAWLLLFSVLGGMVLSTWQRGSFRLDWRPRRSWLRNLSGGVLMGFGAMLVPGGNDALILYGVPTFSPHALPAFIALFAGAMVGVLLLSRLGIDCRVVCRDDIFVARDQPPDSMLKGHESAARKS